MWVNVGECEITVIVGGAGDRIANAVIDEVEPNQVFACVILTIVSRFYFYSLSRKNSFVEGDVAAVSAGCGGLDDL